MNLPFSEDAEKALLSCALHGLEAAKPICAKVGFGWFYIPAHQTVFAAIEELVNTNTAVDWHTVLNGLAGQIEEIGGKEWLSSLFGVVPSPDNWEHYAAIVLDCYDRRRLILNCQRAINAARDGDADAAFNALSVKRTEQPVDEEVIKSANSAMIDLCSFLEREETLADWLPVGVRALETVVPHFTPGQLVLIGGKRGSCKTALAVSMTSFLIEENRCNKKFGEEFQESTDSKPLPKVEFEYREDLSSGITTAVDIED
jgi:replicative DNA helicase